MRANTQKFGTTMHRSSRGPVARGSASQAQPHNDSYSDGDRDSDGDGDSVIDPDLAQVPRGDPSARNRANAAAP